MGPMPPGPLDARLPESLLADAVRGDYSHARHHDSAHCLAPRKRFPLTLERTLVTAAGKAPALDRDIRPCLADLPIPFHLLILPSTPKLFQHRVYCKQVGGRRGIRASSPAKLCYRRKGRRTGSLSGRSLRLQQKGERPRSCAWLRSSTSRLDAGRSPIKRAQQRLGVRVLDWPRSLPPPGGRRTAPAPSPIMTVSPGRPSTGADDG